MTNTSDDLSLSRLELVVLARLSSTKPPGPKDLADAVSGLAVPTESPARAKEMAIAAFAALLGRGLTSYQRRQRKLTEEGYRALRAALDLGHTPTWTEVRDAHLPALALGLRPGSEEATKKLKNKETITVAVLGAEYGVPEASTLIAVCDALILQALGLPPGRFSMERVRAHVLGRRAKADTKGELPEIATRIAAKAVGARAPVDKRAMSHALGRRWASQVAISPDTQPASAEQVSPVHAGARSPSPESTLSPAQVAAPPSSPVQADATEMLLTVVRETIPRVGVDGRFGSEKVFISAIWRSIERDRRLTDLSLDRFKRWLVTANRDGWLVLARADLVSAMDAKLVAESEIEDQGATFHFVLDHRTGTPGAEQGIHAR